MHSIARQYLETALWSSTDEHDVPLDRDYSFADLSNGAIADAEAVCADFVKRARGADLADLSDSDIGHDLWLTRNGHGVGFWARGMGDAGDRLTTLAESYGAADACVTDDGAIAIDDAWANRQRARASLFKAARFFQEHAGYVAGERAKGALALARAERDAKTQGITLVWQDEPDPDFSFVDTWTPAEQKRWHASDHFAEWARAIIPCTRCADLGWDAETCRHAESLASLGGIVDADQTYRRVVNAELASEALSLLAERAEQATQARARQRGEIVSP